MARLMPHGRYMNIKVTTPLSVIIALYGNAFTALTLWKSNHDRSPLPGRKVKKSLKIFLCVITLLMIATC